MVMAEIFKHLKYTQTTSSNTIKVNKHNSRTSQLKEGKFKFILVSSSDPTLYEEKRFCEQSRISWAKVRFCDIVT